MSDFFSLFSHSFIAVILLSIAVATIGSIMLLNRYSYTAASIAHGSYGGIGLALYFGVPMLLGTTLFALALALVLAAITYGNKERNDLLIGLIWAVGMSVGIIAVDASGGYGSDLMSFLFGDILMVPKSDLVYMALVDLLLIGFVALFYNHLLAIAYEEDFAKLRGINVKALHYATLLLIALTVVMSIRSVGLILVIALFSIPPFIAERFTHSLKAMIPLSGVLSFIFSLAGLLISYSFDISATASIILVSAAAFLISMIRKRE